jgi:hypothetical protein
VPTFIIGLSSALAIDGTAIAMAARAAKTQEIFFIHLSRRSRKPRATRMVKIVPASGTKRALRFCNGDGEPMKPRFCTSSVGVSDAVESAWRTYAMLYDKPAERDKLVLEAYIHKLVINGERNQDQLTVKALLYLKKREGKVISDL